MKRRRHVIAAAVVLAASIMLGVPDGSRAGDVPRPSSVTLLTLPTDTSGTMFGLSFPDRDHGFVVGQGGMILATSDGGTTWVHQSSGTGEILRDVSFVDPLHGFVVGTGAFDTGEPSRDGSILATVDGGRTWTPRPAPAIDTFPGGGPGRVDGQPLKYWTFRSVAFTDTQHGVVVGDGGAILTTSDAGATWSWRGDRRYGFVTGVSFADPSHGQVVAWSGPAGGDLFVSLTTSDGGVTWQPRRNLDVSKGVSWANLTAVASVDPARTYVGGGLGRVFVTTDGGASWQVQRRDTTETFESVAFHGLRRGIAVGYTDFSDYRRASLVSTDDGGETWSAHLVDGAILWDVAYASPSVAYGVGCVRALGPAVVSGDDAVRSCEQSLILRVSFVDASASGGPRRGSTAWPLFLGGLGAVLLTASVVGWRLCRRVR